MITFILIVVLGGSTNQSGYTTVNAEFKTFDACEYARKHIVTDALSRDRSYGLSTPVITHGCFAKG